ncbi:DUF6510 family protein [Nocardia sp. CDC153]|uniref:DUF6510 family protein n=1 Tax=Nocardia sp. CDC153 TaxID=3112167 RepID=UPI002DBA205B|nr:DUF6510 family protein [Nocardia sp. CDC153]MEC3953027.1 DUF6510 family protein [Nocardia sp. CDC153]
MTIPYTYATAGSDDRYVDGNALAGLLSEIFSGDPTVHECRCGACHSTEPLARALVYMDGPGTVIRCAHCAAVMLQLTTTPTGTHLTVVAETTLHFHLDP